MAGQSDGAIVVDAEINAAAFGRGSEALKREMAKLQKRFDSVAKQLESSVAQYGKALMSGDNNSIPRFSDKLDKAQAAANRFRDVVLKLGEEHRILTANIEKAQAALERLQNRQEKMDAAGVDKNSKAYRGLLYDMSQVKNELKDYQAQLSQSLGAKEGVDIPIDSKHLQEFADAIERIKEQFSDLRKDADIGPLTTAIEKAESAVERYQARVDKMSALGATESQWQSIRYDIGKAAESAGALSEELDALNQYGGLDESQYDNLSQRLQDVIGRFNAMAEAANETEEGTRKIPPVIRGIGAAISLPFRAFKALVSSVAELGASLAKMTGAGFLYFMRTFAQSAGEAAQSLSRMSAHAVTSGIKRLGAWLSNAAKSMTLFGRSAKRNNGVLKKSFMTVLRYGLGIRSLYYLFNKIRQAIKEGFQNLSGYSDDLNKSLSEVLSSFTRFKNQIAAAFAPIVNVVAPALANLINLLSDATFRAGEFFAALSGQKTVIRAKEVQEDFNASLDATKKAAKAVKNQLAGFDELNILQKKDDEGLSPEEMFETIPVGDEAKRLAEKFKEAWENVDLTEIGGIIGGKIKIALDGVPWDAIKQAASDTGKRLATFINGLINVPQLGQSLGKSVAEAINTAFSFLDGFAWKFDWEGLGNFIMDTIAGFIDNLDWGLANHALQGLARGFADTLNAIFSRVEVWEKVGSTIGKGINAAVSAGITFLERFDFQQAARAIVAGLNKAVETIEWDKIGRLFADYFGGALQFLHTAITEFNWGEFGDGIAEMVNEFVAVMLERIAGIEWSEIGAKIAEGVNRAVSGIRWDELGTLIGRLLGGALTAAASFIRGLDYGEIVRAIQDFLSNALQQIDWHDLLTVWGLATLIVALKTIIAAHPLLAILVGAVLALGPELGNVLQKMISDIQWADVGKTISDCLIWALSRLNEAAENADWVAVSESLFRGLTETLLNIDWLKLIGLLGELLINCFALAVEIVLGALGGVFGGIGDALEEAGHDVIAGFFKGIGDWFTGVGEWLRQNVFDPFIGWFKKLFGIASPSTVMEEQGGFIVSGLFSGIVNAWHTITDFFSGALDSLKTTLGGAWETISGAASTAWNGISTTLSGIMGDIASTISGALETIKTDASGKLSEVSKTVSDNWNAMKTTASSAWEGLKKTVGDTISGVKRDAIAKVSEIVNETKAKWDKIRTDASNQWNNVKSAIVPKAQEIRSQVAGAFQSLQSTLSSVWSGIRSAASGALSSVSATVSSMASSISSRVSSIRSTVNNITSSASSALSKVADKMDEVTRRNATSFTIGGLASGGVVTNGGYIRSWYDSVRKYASGTSRAMGSLFVAGEAGPELVGHVNGKTEVLNESQIASAIYGAVLAAMQEAVSTLGAFLSQQMASNTNALIAAIGQSQGLAPIELAPDSVALLERLSALSGVPYQTPAYAAGTVTPYEIVAEIRRQTSEITSAIYDNGQIVISAVASAISNHGLAMADAIKNMPGGQGQGYSPDYLAQYVIDEINTRTRMMGKSPLL